MTADAAPPAPAATGFLQILRNTEFRGLWFADLQSQLGDQLARVALSVLVFAQTSSSLLTAGVYALTYLPAVLGSVLLGSLADRVRRRALLVGGDLIRAAVLAAMAVPVLPLWALAALLALAVAVGAPWKAAESALVADILEGERYALGTGLRIATVQGTQLLGFAAGGAAVGVIGPRAALMIDAASFACSALIIARRVGDRPAPDRQASHRWSTGVSVIAATPALRLLLGFSWLTGLLVVPEGLAAPYAAHVGGGAAATGLLLAAGPSGVLVGSLVLMRLVSTQWRARSVAPLAVAAGLPLVACSLDLGLLGTSLLWALSGIGTAFQAQIIVEFVQAVPTAQRGQAIAVASAGLLAVQGIGLLLGGMAAQLWSTPTAVTAAGVAATVVAALLALARSASRLQA